MVVCTKEPVCKSVDSMGESDHESGSGWREWGGSGVAREGESGVAPGGESGIGLGREREVYSTSGSIILHTSVKIIS